jgi:hypothetical protein
VLLNLIANALQYRERVSVVVRLHVKREDDVLPRLADVSVYIPILHGLKS